MRTCASVSKRKLNRSRAKTELELGGLLILPKIFLAYV
jgi:hypothetical protein